MKSTLQIRLRAVGTEGGRVDHMRVCAQKSVDCKISFKKPVLPGVAACNFLFSLLLRQQHLHSRTVPFRQLLFQAGGTITEAQGVMLSQVTQLARDRYSAAQ